MGEETGQRASGTGKRVGARARALAGKELQYACETRDGHRGASAGGGLDEGQGGADADVLVLDAGDDLVQLQVLVFSLSDS